MICGGNPGMLWPSERQLSSDMTAISWTYRPQFGFVLAADGRAEWVAETPDEQVPERIANDRQQKIFAAQFRGRDIAIGFTGFVFNHNKTFDLIADSLAILASLNRCQNLYDYVDRFSNGVRNAFNNAKQDGRIKEFTANPNATDSPEPNLIARIFFAGYFRKNDPSVALVSFYHDNGTVLEPRRKYESPPQQDYLSGGRGEIARLIFEGGENHWVRTYARPVLPNCSFQDLKMLGRGFIEACSDARAGDLDPACKGIGGHIHVARLTPQGGFEWDTPPLSD
jgi:hypothetical protein